MAGTDRTRAEKALRDIDTTGAPAVILINPQLGENIGMAARAMLNCGLTDMRLVAPRDGWPNDSATNAASGALVVLENARVFSTTTEAVTDLNLVFASTARGRDMTKPVVTPRKAAAEMHEAWAASASKAGILLGPEAKGLHNDDVALADAVLTAQINPGFSSINLAQAVLLFGYEWYQASIDVVEREVPISAHTRPATKEELVGFFEHLERELDNCGFLHVKEKRPSMVRNLRNLFQRANLTEQEVRSLRGIVSGLATGRGGSGSGNHD
ncbi:MAG: RNA methyltransferase [Rhodospirillales bacterium]|nr:RNA methyltransferase [Rhodospirillales bacterium]